MVDSLAFTHKFLPSSFIPPLLKFNFTSASPPLLPAPSQSRDDQGSIKFNSFSYLDAELAHLTANWVKLSTSLLPHGWPIALPFRRVRCVGFPFQDTLPPSITKTLHFPNFVVDQTLLEVSIVVDLSTARDFHSISLPNLQLALFTSPESSKVPICSLFHFKYCLLILFHRPSSSSALTFQLTPAPSSFHLAVL